MDTIMTSMLARAGWVHSDSLRLRYIEWGPIDAPAIIMLHGLRSYAHTWEPVAEPLADRWRCIALDQRGRGESDWDPQRNYFADAYVRDLEALVEHLGLRRFVLMGHSMGGANAFIYAARHPDNLTGLVIEDMGPGASLGSNGADRIRRELLATPERFDTWEAATVFWRRQRPKISDAALRSRVMHSLKATADGGVTWKHDAQGIASARLNASPEQLVDLWPHVDAVRAPTLVLRGANSDFLSAQTAQEMSHRNPLITCVDVPDASHYVHDDNLQGFASALHPFLRDIAVRT
jgi:pimeloyl-ACP methyl ester carboxylesterase